MTIIDQKMKNFQSKPYEEKLEISMNIISNLKNRGNKQAQEIYDKLSKMEDIPETIIDAIYKDFCDSVNRIRQQKTQGELRKFDTAKVHIQKLRQKEENQKNSENNETLLDGLNYL